MYKSGLITMPVCPTCSSWGRQPASETGFEQAVAAPKESASSSKIFQFSGPFKPLPPETTISASGNDTLFVVLTISFTVVLKSDLFKLTLNSSIDELEGDSIK